LFNIDILSHWEVGVLELKQRKEIMCDLQGGVFRSYSGNTEAPYYVAENKHDVTVNVKCSLTDIAERLEQTDDLTHEEQRVKDSFIVKHFKTEQLSELAKVKQTRQALREGKKTKNNADGIDEFHGGVRKQGVPRS
jgi:hypothetical protein